MYMYCFLNICKTLIMNKSEPKMRGGIILTLCINLMKFLIHFSLLHFTRSL